MRHGAKPVRVKGLIRHQIRGFDAQQIFERAGNVVAFSDLIKLEHRAFKPFLGGFGMFGQPDSNVDDIGLPGLNRVQPCTISGNDAAPFKVLNAAQARRSAEPDLIRKREVTYAAIATQFTQYPRVD